MGAIGQSDPKAGARGRRVRRIPALAITAAAGALLMLSPGAQAVHSAETQPPLYKDPRQPIPARVEDLLQRMTLEEKVAQMQGVWENKGDIQTSDGTFSLEKAEKAFPNGVGQISRPSDRRGDAGPGAGRRRGRRGRRAGSRGEPRCARDGRLHQRGPALGGRAHATRDSAAVPRRGAARLRGARRHLLPAGDRPRLHLGPRPADPGVLGRGPRDARTRGHHRARARGGRGPRSALGPHRGDLRRGPVSGRRHGRGRRTRLPGRRPAAGGRQGVRHAQAPDRPRPAGERDQRGPRAVRRADPARDVLPPVPAGDRQHPDHGRHALVQRDRRPALARQPLAAHRRASRGVGLQGRDDQRLLRHQGADHAPSYRRQPR